MDAITFYQTIGRNCFGGYVLDRWTTQLIAIEQNNRIQIEQDDCSFDRLGLIYLLSQCVTPKQNMLVTSVNRVVVEGLLSQLTTAAQEISNFDLRVVRSNKSLVVFNNRTTVSFQSIAQITDVVHPFHITFCDMWPMYSEDVKIQARLIGGLNIDCKEIISGEFKDTNETDFEIIQS